MSENGEEITRSAELSDAFDGIDDGARLLIGEVIENITFLESQMKELRRLPMIRVNPADPQQQKATPASKLLKEFIQQHANCVKLAISVLQKNAPEEVSPLRQWLDERNKQYESG